MVSNLKKGKYRLDIRNKFFTVRAVRLWHRLSREVGEVPVPGDTQAQAGQGS